MTSGYPGPGPRIVPAANLDVDELVRALGASTAAKYDPDGDAALAEFQAERTVNAVARKRLKKLFKTIDLDGNGSVELTEFRKLIMQCDAAELGLPQVQLSDVFDIADCDGNNSIDYNEFLAWLGLGSSREDEHDEVMPECKTRSKRGGPTRISVGTNCWREVETQSIFDLAQSLALWQPDEFMTGQLQQHRQEIERIRLSLGELENELLQRRLRARGAMRKWVADNYSLSSKAYMNKVDEITKRDNLKAAQRRALETDPEAAEHAQLTAWTLTQKLDRLSKEHEKLCGQLMDAEEKESKVADKAIKEVSDQVGKSLFPIASAATVGPLRADELCQDAGCIVRTSIDAVRVPGEDVVVCIDVRIDDDAAPPPKPAPEKRRSSKRRSTPTMKFEKLSRPVDFVLIVDQSASMAEDIPHVSRSVCDFVETMQDDDRLSVVAMADSPAVLLDWTDMDDAGRVAARTCAEKFSASGNAPFIAAGKLLSKQLESLGALDKENKARGPRQKVVLFIADGRPVEGRDAVFDFFTRSLAPYAGDLLFAALALGPEADAPLLSEICHATQGAMFYTSDENTLDEVIGQVWAMARTVAMKTVCVALRPMPGCGIAEAESFSGDCSAGPRWTVAEIPLDHEDLMQKFRCIVQFDNESDADKLCKWTGGDGKPVYLAAPLREGPDRGSRVARIGGEGPVLAHAGLRLLRIHRKHFLAKTAAKKAPMVFAAQETVGRGGFESRPEKLILTRTVSRGPILLEFEPMCWRQDAFELAEDVVTDELTVFKGSRLMGYKFGSTGSLETELLEWPSEGGGGYSTIIDALGRIDELAGTRNMILVFDLRCSFNVINLGNLLHGASRQICARLRVPNSVLSRRRGRDDGDDLNLPLLDVQVVGWLNVSDGGPARKLTHRVGLTVAQVPSIIERTTSASEMTLRLSFAGQIEVSGEEIANALVAAANLHQGQLVADSIQQQGPGIMDLQFQEAGGNELGETLSAVLSDEAVNKMSTLGSPLLCRPVVVGGLAFRRFCQWRLAQGLRIAADTGSWQALEQVRAMCLSDLGKAMDPMENVQDSHLYCIAAEASAAVASFQVFECWRHRLHGLSSAHARQLPVSTALGALEIYATRRVWQASVAPAVSEIEWFFASSARQRDQEPECVRELQLIGVDFDSISVKFGAVEGNGQPITSYTVQARDFETGQVTFRSVRKENFGGEFEPGTTYQVTLDQLASGRLYLVCVHGWNGRKGPASDPIWCATPENSLSAGWTSPGKRPTLKV